MVVLLIPNSCGISGCHACQLGVSTQLKINIVRTGQSMYVSTTVKYSVVLHSSVADKSGITRLDGGGGGFCIGGRPE